METVGNRIEALARAKGLPTGKALAKMLGVSYEALRKWKSGDIVPSRARQQVIADALGVSAATFMHGASGAVSGEPLAPEEARLLRAWRVLLREDRTAVLRQVEQRARELEELSIRLRMEMGARATSPYGKRTTRVA